jgi:peptide deformylase
MILPITVYGNPVLRKETEDIDKNYPNLPELLQNMFDTMENADGVGLAAPQIGLNIRVFVINLSCLADEHPEYKDYKKTMINPEIIEFLDDDVSMEEGCLSLPGIHENVLRKDTIIINYLDENFVEHQEKFTGYPARVIQHEYDHLEGNLFIDHISGIRRQLIKGKLNNISSGKINCKYRIKN